MRSLTTACFMHRTTTPHHHRMVEPRAGVSRLDGVVVWSARVEAGCRGYVSWLGSPLSGGLANSRRFLRLRRGACCHASLAHFYSAFGSPFLRRCYHQILGPRGHLTKLSNGVCRYSEIFVCLNSHLIWQAAKSDVERGSAFGLISHRASLIARYQLSTLLRGGRRAETSRGVSRLHGVMVKCSAW
jgi:hypothetical protein